MGLPIAVATVLSLALASSGCRRTPSVVSRVYVTNEDDGTVSVIDPARDEVVATIAVGKRPRGIRPSPDGRWLYVALSGSPKGGPGVDERALPAAERAFDGIGVIDVATSALVRTLPSGPDPESFDVSPDGKTLYVSNEDAGEVSVVDVAAGRVRRTLEVGDEPEGVAVSPDGRSVYVTSEAANEVTVIDTAREEVTAHVPTRERPRAVLFARDGLRAFVTSELGATVHVVDARSHAPVRDVAIAQRGARPMGIALSPDGRTLYVTNGRGGGLVMIDAQTGDVLRSVEGIAPRPWGIGVSPDGAKLYVAGGPPNDVVVLDAKSGAVRKRVHAGASPWGVAVTGSAPSPKGA